MKGIVTDFQTTGPCTIDINEVVKQWDTKRWYIAQWGEDNFRLVKRDLRSRELVKLKVTISLAQARELIEKLELKSHPTMLRSANTWK